MMTPIEKKLLKMLKRALEIINDASLYGLDIDSTEDWYSETYKYVEKLEDKKIKTKNK